MWVLFAVGSALFAGVTSILAKRGLSDMDSTLATALRTGVVLAFAWLMVWVTGAGASMAALTGRTLLFLALSGLGTGASWLCYFRALQLGDVSRVAPIDKSSTIMTMLLAALFLGEVLTWIKGIAMLAMLAGTMLMTLRAPDAAAPVQNRRGWLLYAVLSAVFASLTALLGKLGMEGISSTLGTALRTIVVLVMAWMMVLVKGKQHAMRHLDRNGLIYLIVSGITTGLSWLCYYRALQMGPASVVVPIDKLSILVTVAFSVGVLHEKLAWRAWAGLALIVAGTLALLL